MLYIFSLQYLDRFDLSPTFTIEEFRHWFIPRQGIVDTYVVEASSCEPVYYIYSWCNGLGTLNCKGLKAFILPIHFRQFLTYKACKCNMVLCVSLVIICLFEEFKGSLSLCPDLSLSHSFRIDGKLAMYCISDILSTPTLWNFLLR